MLAALALAALVAASAGPQAAHAQQAPAAPTPTTTSATAPRSTGAKIWIGHEREIEEYIKTAPIDHIAKVPVGVTHPVHAFFAPGGPVAGIVFKQLPPGRREGYFESYKSEIAAYRLDQMLGLGMVPPTVEREYQREVGSAQLWVENCKLLKQVDPNASKDIAAWNRQVYRQRVWDNLTGNIDRNAGNLLVDSEFNLILIDHSRAFANTMQMPFPMTRIDREFFEHLKALTEQDVKTQLSGLLFDGPAALFKRRDYIVKHFEQLIKKEGEAAVLIP